MGERKRRRMGCMCWLILFIASSSVVFQPMPPLSPWFISPISWHAPFTPLPLSLALYLSQWAELSGMLYLLINFVIFQMFMHFSSYKMSTHPSSNIPQTIYIGRFVIPSYTTSCWNLMTHPSVFEKARISTFLLEWQFPPKRICWSLGCSCEIKFNVLYYWMDFIGYHQH